MIRKLDPEYFAYECLTVEQVECVLNESVELLSQSLQVNWLSKSLNYVSVIFVLFSAWFGFVHFCATAVYVIIPVGYLLIDISLMYLHLKARQVHICQNRTPVTIKICNSKLEKLF